MGRDTTKLHYWAEHIKQWQTSGLSQRAYCVREDIKWATFDYWRRQILSDKETGQATKKKPSRKGLTLVPVQVRDKPSNEAIVLRSPTGWELRLVAADPAWLAEVLKRLT